MYEVKSNIHPPPSPPLLAPPPPKVPAPIPPFHSPDNLYLSLPPAALCKMVLPIKVNCRRYSTSSTSQLRTTTIGASPVTPANPATPLNPTVGRMCHRRCWRSTCLHSTHCVESSWTARAALYYWLGRFSIGWYTINCTCSACMFTFWTLTNPFRIPRKSPTQRTARMRRYTWKSSGRLFVWTVCSTRKYNSGASAACTSSLHWLPCLPDPQWRRYFAESPDRTRAPHRRATCHSARKKKETRHVLATS